MTFHLKELVVGAITLPVLLSTFYVIGVIVSALCGVYRGYGSFLEHSTDAIKDWKASFMIGLVSVFLTIIIYMLLCIIGTIIITVGGIF